VENTSLRQHSGQGVRPSTNSTADVEANAPTPSRTGRWRGLTQASDGSSADGQRKRTTQESRPHDSMGSRWDIKTRLEMLVANQAEKVREKLRPTTDTDSLPVTFIPAPARQGTALEQVLEEEGISRRSGSSDSDGDERRRNQSQVMAGVPGAPSTDSVSPPLWPGVRRRLVTYENDDEYSYTDGSLEESGSEEDSEEHESDGESGPSREAGGNGEAGPARRE
jgi:hypothetical protein